MTVRFHLPRERGFDGDADFREIRSFLAELFPRTPPGLLWDVRMWDGCYFCDEEPWGDTDRKARTRLFEDTDGRLVAALLSEGGDELHLEVHPEARSLEPALLARGEAVNRLFGETSATVLLWDHDVFRKRLLEKRGYQPTKAWACLYRTRLEGRTLPRRLSPEGYVLRPTHGEKTTGYRPTPLRGERVAALLNAAFDRDRHHAGEVRGFRRGAPCFRPDLDLVAEAPDGTLAAYAPVCWDDHNQRGIFEPVCTHPAHRRRGLAKALMIEGLHRARSLGAVSMDVSTGDQAPAHALYRSVGFEEAHRATFWKKELD